MRPLFNSALVVSLLCVSLVAQTTQTSPPKSGKIPAQKPRAGREITPQQEQANSVLNNLFERTKEFADDKTRIEAQAQIADALWQYDQKTARRQFTEAFRSIAARKAEEAGDFDQAIAITEKLNDKRMGMDVSLIRNSAAIKAGDKGDIDAAYRYAKELPDPDQVRALCRIALKSCEKGDLQRANELINEAEKMIAKSGPTPEKVFALLDVAAAATTINPVSGFEVVNTVVGVINQIYSAKSHSSRRDFIRDSMTFEKSLGMLARADFQRAMRLAMAITQGEVSALAQLAVCRGVLVEPKE